MYLHAFCPGFNTTLISLGQVLAGHGGGLSRQQHLQRLANLDSPIEHLLSTTEPPKSAHSSLHQFVQSLQSDEIIVVSEYSSPSAQEMSDVMTDANSEKVETRVFS